MTFDLLIRDGTIIDGTGGPRFRGDVGVSRGMIASIGDPDLAGAEGRHVVSASRKFVTPGFIDITSHADKSGSLFANPLQDYLLTQGVTTILVGNCGLSLAPLASRDALASFSQWAAGAEASVNWLTTAEFLAELSGRPLGVNAATLIGQGTLRRGLLPGASRPLAPEELLQSVTLLRQGIREGAFGLSTGLTYGEEAAATAEELAAIARASAAEGGIVKIHLRNEGTNLIPSMNEAVRLARESNVGVIISHLKAIGRKSWPLFKQAIGMIERASEDGLRISFDLSPYQRTGSLLSHLLPPWARAGDPAEMLERIRQTETRTRVVQDLARQTLHYERYLIGGLAPAGAQGRTIAELAARMSQPPEETVLDLLVASRGRAAILGNTLAFRNVALGATHPLGAIASDGSGVSVETGRAGSLVHPRSTGAFPHFLHKFVREKNLLSWEEGIRKITSLPAQLAGIKSRGRIAPKFAADIVVFDPDQIRDRSTYQNPFVHPVGIEAVAVNGELAVESGQLTGAAGGKVLRKS